MEKKSDIETLHIKYNDGPEYDSFAKADDNTKNKQERKIMTEIKKFELEKSSMSALSKIGESETHRIHDDDNQMNQQKTRTTRAIKTRKQYNFELSLFEMSSMSSLSKFAKHNVRKIKRIYNLYSLARLFVDQDDNFNSFTKKVLVWIILCEQWPLRMCLILHRLDDIAQRGSNKLQNKVKKITLLKFYRLFVEDFMYDIGKRPWPEVLKCQYENALGLDMDMDLFFILMKDNDNEISIDDIRSLDMQMDFSIQKKLSFYSFSLNPAIFDMLGRIDAYREDLNDFAKRLQTKIAHPTLVGHVEPRLETLADFFSDCRLDFDPLQRSTNGGSETDQFGESESGYNHVQIRSV